MVCCRRSSAHPLNFQKMKNIILWGALIFIVWKLYQKNAVSTVTSGATAKDTSFSTENSDYKLWLADPANNGLIGVNHFLKWLSDTPEGNILGNNNPDSLISYRISVNQNNPALRLPGPVENDLPPWTVTQGSGNSDEIQNFGLQESALQLKQNLNQSLMM